MLEQTDREATILVNPSEDFSQFEAKINYSLSELEDRKPHEKEDTLPTVRGGKGKLRSKLQLVNGKVKTSNEARILRESEKRVRGFSRRTGRRASHIRHHPGKPLPAVSFSFH